nr:helix-turn-helix domain-containing protein [uncultured Steroidobacter sp.]
MSAQIIPQELHDEARLTTEQVAHITGISKQTYEGWRSRNRKGGPSYERLGPQLVRYRWGTVREWLEASTVKVAVQ